MSIWQLHSTLVAAGLIVDSGANQQLTYSDKFLVNVIDISKFGIKVSHPNGTEALITKVGNMVLTKDITLYDVLVVSEYCVSLMSVHKIARDSKLIVAFDESHCYVLPKGLREMKCLGIGKQKDGFNHPHCSSPTIDHNEDDVGHLYGSNGSASEDEMAATFKEQLSNSEGITNNVPIPMGTEQVHRPLRRSKRVSTLPRRYNDFVMASKVMFGLEKFVNYSKLSSENKCFATELSKNHEPKTFWEASSNQHWVDVTNKEMDALYENNTWEITELPSNRKVIGSKCVFKIKYKSAGEIKRYKARFVAKRFNQKEGIDFDETFPLLLKLLLFDV
ncbi:ribonuclease H-like domain-containing protein [Tanacetum coccineum]